jgi:ketosteroid isomerase-like protein
MKRMTYLGLLALFLCLFPGSVSADDSKVLIDLDQKWGEAGIKGDPAAVAKFLGDDLVSVTVTGVSDKASQLADTEAAPAGTKYEPTDFKVVFLDATTAIMTHGTKGDDAHYSLHVWSKKGGSWKVVATSTTPAESD